MPTIELRRTADFAYREAVPEPASDQPPVLCLHGFPESSRMWEQLLAALADSGRRALAPDLFGLGDSPDDGPATFERNREAVAEFAAALSLERVTLVVHDWGGFVGLAWACEHPQAVAAMVISDAGFFPDGRWHGMAEAVRSPQGEELVANIDRDGFAAMLRSSGEAFDEDDIAAYWAPFETGRGQRTTLEFYRSMDFGKLEPYDGKLGGLGVPTLLLWGADDPFAPLGGARRFQREIPGADLVVVEGAGHFVYDSHPERCAREVLAFLDGAGL